MPTFGSTSYDWAGAGRREWLIEVTTDLDIAGGASPASTPGNIVNGNVVGRAPYTGNFPMQTHGFFCTSSQSGKHIKFKWPWPVKIDELKWIQDDAGTQGHWIFAGSNDDVTYTTLWTDDSSVHDFDLGGASAVDVHSFQNENGYQYYKLIQVSGTTTNSRWIEEVEFKLARESTYGVGGPVEDTSYTGPGSTGNRKSTMLAMLNHDAGCGGDDSGYWNMVLNGVVGVANCTDANAFNVRSDYTITFSFRDPVVCNGFKWHQALASASHGTWTIEGSRDFVSWDEIATGLVFGVTTDDEVLFTNSLGYNFYRLVQTSGSTNNTTWVYEVEFKTAGLSLDGVTPGFEEHNEGSGFFVVQPYVTLTMEAWGGGGAGVSTSVISGVEQATTGDGGTESTVSTFGISAGGGGPGGAGPSNNGGIGGTASGGLTENTDGNAGGVGSTVAAGRGVGAGAPHGGGDATPPSSSGNGNDGSVPGGGGSGVKEGTSTYPGGGSGAYSKTVFLFGDSDAPLVGDLVAYSVGPGGAHSTAGAVIRAGGDGGHGRVRFTWSNVDDSPSSDTGSSSDMGSSGGGSPSSDSPSSDMASSDFGSSEGDAPSSGDLGSDPQSDEDPATLLGVNVIVVATVY